MELPQRKRTRLQGYDYSQEGAYFITVCTKNKACILGKICVGDGVLDIPQVQLTKFGHTTENRISEINRVYTYLQIIKYVIMPNHIHMIVLLNGHDGTSRTPSPYECRYTSADFKLQALCKPRVWYEHFSTNIP